MVTIPGQAEVQRTSPAGSRQQVVPGVRADAADFGADVGRALQQGAGQGVALLEDLTRKEETRKLNEARTSAHAALKQVELDLSEDDEFETLEDRYDVQSKAIKEEFSRELRGEALEAFNLAFDQSSASVGLNVQGMARSGIRERGAASFARNLDQLRETMADAGNDAEYQLGFDLAREMLASGVEAGYFDTQAGQETLDAWVNDVRRDQANRMIINDPELAVEVLENDELDGLRESSRLTLLKQAKVQARMVEAERLRVVSGLVSDAVHVLDRGITPSNLETVRAAAAGTEFEPVLARAIEDRQVAAGFVTMPLPSQARQLREMAGRESMSRREVDTFERLQRTHGRLVKAVDQGRGLALAAEAGVIPAPEQLSFDDPDSLRRRAVQAEAASEWVGTAISPMTPDEEEALTSALNEATPGQVTQILSTLHGGLGEEQAGRLAGELAARSPELAAAISLAPDMPLVARDIVLGGRLARENPDVVPTRTDRVPVVETVFGNLFTPESAGALSAYQEAAAALYAARRIPTGDLTFDPNEYERALRDVAGGPVELNGRMILPPVPGMEEDAVEDLVEGLTDEDLARFGNGQPVFADGSAFTVELFDRGLFRSDAQLITSGPGRYLVFLEGLGFVQSDAGGAYEIDLRAKVR